MKRLACWLRGHRPIRVIDRIELLAFTLIRGHFEMASTITEDHYQCLRCRQHLHHFDRVVGLRARLIGWWRHQGITTRLPRNWWP